MQGNAAQVLTSSLLWTRHGTYMYMYMELTNTGTGWYSDSNNPSMANKAAYRESDNNLINSIRVVKMHKYNMANNSTLEITRNAYEYF